MHRMPPGSPLSAQGQCTQIGPAPMSVRYITIYRPLLYCSNYRAIHPILTHGHGYKVSARDLPRHMRRSAAATSTHNFHACRRVNPAHITRTRMLNLDVCSWGSYDASFRIHHLGRTPDILTPNIDNISSNGIRFDNYYVQPICSPTRASLLSGRCRNPLLLDSSIRLPSRYSIHTGSEHRLFGASEPSCLPVDLPLMPAAFKAIGYQTHMIGKVPASKASCLRV